MILKLMYQVLILFLFVTFFACSSKPKHSRKPVSNIKIENKQNKLVSGESLTISVNTRVKNGELKETKLYIDNDFILSTKDLVFTKTINNFLPIGEHTIKIVSEKLDGVEGINYKSFKVLSDIIPEKYDFKVVNVFPHNTKHFTEGLEIHNGFLYESTGENGSSGIYKTDLKTAKIYKSVDLDEKYFGEGITIFNDKIYQLTYHAKKGFIYDLDSFKVLDEFTFSSEQGWGMTHTDSLLIMSDGTHILSFLDVETLETIKQVQVFDNKGPVNYLNELEYYNGYIYSNVWTTDKIVKIDISSGKVIAEIDLKGILATYNTEEQIDLLNGIAIDKSKGNIYVTGKWWPKLFEIELLKKE